MPNLLARQHIAKLFAIIFSLLATSCGQAGNWIVSTANSHASRAAAEMLAKGGSAADAAIAAQMVLTLVEPQSSGIGGGAFALYWQNGTKTLMAIDGRETAPQAADQNLFLKPDGTPMRWQKASIGGRAVGAPGVVALAELLHKKFGRLSWQELFEPAIKLAENGFKVSPRLHGAVSRARTQLFKDAGARAIYFLPGTDKPLPVGYLLKNPALAQSLKTIARQGARGFYEGEIARKIVASVRGHKENPGLLSLDDLKNYRAIARQAVCAPYRNFKICGMPPPTSGGLTSLMMLGILENFSLSAMTPGSLMAMHLFTQASRLAYADRDVYMGDTDFVDVPIKGLLDKTYLRGRAKLINPLKDMGKAKPGLPRRAEPTLRKTAGLKVREYGTSHFSIIDAFGNAVSITTSVERGFGGHITAGGFVLNNQLTDFNFVPIKNGVPVANRPQGGKRPRSSMSPTLIFDSKGELYAATGSPGGSRIIEFTTRSIIGLIDWGLSPQAAIDLGNVNNRNRITELEAETPVAGYADTFKKMGHKVLVRPLTSGLHIVMKTPQGLTGGADKRREGLVIRSDQP